MEEAGDGGAGLLDCSAGVLALLVDGTGVAVVFHPIGTHGFKDFREERGGRVGVHVDTAAHGSILPCGWNGDAVRRDDIPRARAFFIFAVERATAAARIEAGPLQPQIPPPSAKDDN